MTNMAAATQVRIQTMCLLIGVVVSTLLAPPVSPRIMFEAAFQGRCGEKSPCEQLCYDLHDGTFECGCREGAVLAQDGYSCVAVNSTESPTSTVGHPTTSINPSSGDEDGDDDDDDSEDMSSEEDDYRVQETVVDGRQYVRIPSLSRTRDHHPSLRVPSAHLNEVTAGLYDRHRPPQDEDESDDDVEIDIETDDDDDDGFDPYEWKPKKTKEGSSSSMPTMQPILAQVPSDSHSAEMRPFQATTTHFDEDNRHRFHFLPRLCANLRCEAGGRCIEDSPHSVRCLCPLGRGGQMCQSALEVRYPRFSGHSYVTFPVLKNAFRDIQITVEFRPQNLNGLLLYSGERANATGDFLSIALVDGHVEFRFDCGSGTALLRSNEPVMLNTWNTLLIYRHRWDAWLQLNGGRHVQGRSRGLYSRITFRESLLVGGSPNISTLVHRIKARTGFEGCIRHLEINEHIYDFRPKGKGEALGGLDIGECSANVCSRINCRHGGTCTVSSADSAICLCPLGYIGEHCEMAVDLVMPSFNGSSHLKYPGLGSSVLSFVELSIVFRPITLDGVIFYNGYKTDGTGDFLSISMSRGHVEFRFDLGTGPAIIRSREPVALYEWHTVFVSRTGRDGILEVDRQPRVEGMAEGAFTQLSLPQNLYLGGVPNFDEVSRKLGHNTNFRGCIQKVVINNRPLRILDAALAGVNVDNCEHPCINRPCMNSGTCAPRNDYFSCHCRLGYTDTRCQTEVLDSIAVPMFVGNSFLKFTQEEIIKRVVGNRISIDLRFRAAAPDGLILWTGEKEMKSSSDYLAVGLKAGVAHLRYNLGSGEVIIIANDTRVDDGRWHRIRIVRNDQEGALIVDDGPIANAASPGQLRQLNTNNGLYLGGMEDIIHLSLNKYSVGFVGCVSELRLATDYRIQLVPQASSGMNIEVCV